MIDAVAAVPDLVIRKFRGEEDLPAMLRVYTAAHEADGVEEVTTLDDLRRNYANLVNCDPARDIFVAEIGGEVVGYARVFWQELVDGGRSYENFGFVHPAWRRRGIGGALHRLNEDRLREIAAEHADVEPKWLASESIDADAGGVALLRGDGYTAARFFYDMVAESLEGIVAPPMPDGLELRPVTRDQYRTIWDASAEAFRDHWGENEWTEAEWIALRRRAAERRPALLASRLGRRRGRRGDRHHRPCRRERAPRSVAGLRLDGLGPPPVASPRPCASPARVVARRRARCRLHVRIAWRRHRLADRRDRPVSVPGVRAAEDVHVLAQAALSGRRGFSRGSRAPGRGSRSRSPRSARSPGPS